MSQSTSSLARVVGPLIAVPLFFEWPPLPYWAATIIMVAATTIFVVFARHGRDYGSSSRVGKPATDAATS